MQTVLIRRKRKYEAAQAMIDLVERGFQVVYPLTEITGEGKIFNRDTYNKVHFSHNTFNSCWIAKLERRAV